MLSILLLLTASMTPRNARADGTAEGECSKSLLDDESLKLTAAEKFYENTKSLMDLVKDGPDNLAYQHPSIVMNANQHLLSMIEDAGVDEVGHEGAVNGSVPLYHFFSSGRDFTSGARVEGHELEIHNFVEQLRQCALGSRSVIILMGPHGTGKSEMLKVAANGQVYYTTHKPDFAAYTFRWKNVAKIRKIREALDLAEDSIDTFQSQMNHSPLVLLPTAVQNKIIQLANPRVRELTKMDARPVAFQGDSWDEFFKSAILEQHKAELSAAKTDQQKIRKTIEILNEYVDIVPLVLGQDGTSPKIDNLNQNDDDRSLFTTPNIVAKLKYGEEHPLSWFTNGKLLKANRGVAFLDEFPRNPITLQQKYLGIFESGRVPTTSSRDVTLDTVFILAGNFESVDRLKQEGGVGALLDRLSLEPFLWSTNPYEIMSTLAYMMEKTVGLEMRELGHMEQSTPEKWVKADSTVLFPRAGTGGRRTIGPDGRYELRMKRGDRYVYIAPHTLMYMAGVLSLTRSIFDMQAARKFGDRSIINSPVFRSPQFRMQYLMGQTNLTSAEVDELNTVRSLIGEGTKVGMSTRDFSRWFEAAISYAVDEARNGANAVITPESAQKVLNYRLDNQKFADVSPALYKVWSRLYSNVMAANIIAPAIENDIQAAMGAQEGDNESLYYEILQQVITLANDSTATHYKHTQTGKSTPIDSDLMAGIERAYSKVTNGDRWDPVAIALMATTARGARPDATDIKHPGLQSAINAYLAEQATKSVTIRQLLNYGLTRQGGSAMVSTTYSGLMTALKDLYGYREEAALAALSFVDDKQSKIQQVKEYMEQNQK